MKNHCKLNPCCADPYDCKPPPQYGTPEGDASYKRQMEASASPSPVDSRDALIERLVKALEPFAKLGDDGWGSACPSERVLAVWWADDDKDPHKTKRPHITQGDIRNARRALLAAKEQQP